MAPSTAALFVALGLAAVLRGVRPDSPIARGFAMALNTAGAAGAALLLALSAFGVRAEAERLGFAAAPPLGDTPVGYMSPITAFCFLLAAASFIASLLPRPAGARAYPAWTAWTAAGLLLAASGVLLLAYLFGSPLLYGSSFVPPAATTSFAFVSLAAAMLALAPRTRRESGEGPEVSGVPAWLALVFLLLSIGIVTVGWLYFRHLERRHRASVAALLTAVADLKAHEVEAWRRERLADASLFAGNTSLRKLTERLLRRPEDADAGARLIEGLAQVRGHSAYAWVALFDRVGKLRLAAEGAADVPVDLAPLAPEADEAPRFVDFYRPDPAAPARLAVLCPIAGANGSILGILGIGIDPSMQLNSLVQRWPTASATAEALLVRRDGDDALLLTELRLRPRTAFAVRVPLAKREVDIVRAVAGETRVVDAFDDRGTPVIAASRAIPDAPWFLVARIEASEADAPLRERLWAVAILVAGMLAAAALAIGALWREQRARAIRERARAERERLWLHDVIARSLDEIYVFDPDSLNFRFANAGACRNLGYSEQEMAGLTPLDIKPDFDAERFRSVLQPLLRREQPLVRFETVHRRKDASTYPVEVHLQLVPGADGHVFLAVISDITERRRAEARIRRLNRTYAVLSAVNQAIVRTREPREVLREACRIAVEDGGFPSAWAGLVDRSGRLQPVARAGAGGAEWLDALPPEERDGQGPVARALREGVRKVYADPARDPKALAAFPLLLDGEPAGALALSADEAAWFDAEELRLLDELTADLSLALKVARVEDLGRTLATATEQAPVAVLITDATGRIEYVNPAFTRITGYTWEEALGGNPRMLKSDLQDPAFYRRMWETIAAGRSWQGELVNRRKDGSLYTQELTVAPVRDDKGAITHFAAIGQDVSERRQAQERLRESEERYRTLFDGNLAGVYRTRMDGRILECNDAFARIFGFASRKEALGADATALFPSAAERQEVLGRLRADGLLTNHEFEARRRDGSPVWLLENARLVREGSDERSWLIDGTLLDVSERRQLEERLRQSQKIEAIGQLAGGVAHDFNNVLGVIVGYGELAQRQLGPDHPVRARVDEMVKAAERAAQLTRQLLAFSRRQVLRPRPLDLNGVVREVERMLARLIGEHIELLVRPAAELGTVSADPGQVEQVLLNLAVNARDAMPDGGRLTIATSNAELDAEYAVTHPPVVPGRYVMLSVSDTGTGMDAGTQQRIFEPFFTTKPEGHGTGLGLATVYGIVKQSGGYIWLYSEPGHGTTFKVYLPRVDAASAAAAPRSEPGPKRGSEVVLLVEDTESLRNVIRETLETHGYTVVAAANGEEALNLARDHAGPIDLLLTDLVMPRLGGAQVAARLNAFRPGIRVLYMSGYPQGGVSAGAAFIEKPFTGEALARAVREALDSAP